MRRRLFDIATVLSLLVCVAMMVLWVRSYSWRDGVGYYDPSSGTRGLHTRRGSMHYLFVSRREATAPGWKNWSGPQPAMYVAISDRPDWSVWGLGYGDASGAGIIVRWVSLPFWLLLICALFPPSLWLWRRRKKSGRGFPLHQKIE